MFAGQSMNSNKDMEYIFWLDYWRESSRQLPKSGRFKCIVTRNSIHVVPTDNDPEKILHLDLFSIQKCQLGYGGRNKQVDLRLSDRKYYFGPVHPIDPHFIQNLNHNEALSLVKVIEAFRSDTNPGIDPNPYTRQLAAKNYLAGFKLPNIQWDTHTSPWSYFEHYQDNFLELRLLARKILIGIIVIPIVVVLILGVAYMLDALNII
jgi:hypothetical protein